MENSVIELTAKIKYLEQELKKLKNNQGYGLKREDKPEEFEEHAKNALPILQEESSMKINNNHHLDHLIIQGDNFHSLSALNYTHRGAIDVIYIDPPYNTGNKDFIYNDSFVDKEDSYRHSKWLSFINKRLQLAKKILSEEGVIFISIDDNELSQLKLLCDEIFGEDNFVANINVYSNPRGRQSSKNIAETHEYVLVYAKNSLKLTLNGNELTEDQKKEYNKKDDKGFYREIGLRKRGSGSRKEDSPNLFFSIYYNTLTSKILLEHTDKSIEIIPKLEDGKLGRWRRSRKKILQDIDLLIARKVKRNNGFEYDIFQKDYISDDKTRKIKTSWIEKEINYDRSSTEQKDIFGEKRFDYAKPLYLMEKIVDCSSSSNSTILDFFAGSGTTGHAVLALNKKDGGQRKFILCSNRENTKEHPNKNICKDITYERVKRVMQGYKNSKGESVEGLQGGNLRYYTTQFIQTTKATDDLRYRFINLCDDILCIKEDTFTSISTNNYSQYLKLFKKNKKYTIILYDIHHFDELLSMIEKLDGEISVYIFSLSKEIYEEELTHINKKITVQNIPDDILQTYKKIFNF